MKRILSTNASRLRHFTSSARALNKNAPLALPDKYADKLKAKMEREGVTSLEQLKAKVRPPAPEKVGTLRPPPPQSSPAATTTPAAKLPPTNPVRKDGSPVMPLGSILNLPKLFQSPHTAEQVASLWTVFHASRSEGTGRGYLSASIPLKTYEAMIARARKYPIFILPIPRAVSAIANADSPDEAVSAAEQAKGTEFFYMEWAFHESPSPPSTSDDLFSSPSTSQAQSSTPLPPIATVLLTPLQEYKLRLSYAQPRLVLTHYTDLAHSHNLVLLRGEITASPSSPGSFLLSQVDAQLLTLGLQKFYVPAETELSKSAFELLKTFHENPEEFDYQRLIELGDAGLGV